MSLSPIMRGLLSGIGGGLGAFQQQQQDEQKQRDAQQKAQQQAELEQKAWVAKQEWENANAPPKTRTETIADPDNPGSNLVKNEHWEPPEKGNDPNLEKGQWLIDSTANDPNSMRIDAANQRAADQLDFKSKALDMNSQLAQSRIDAATARADAAAARRGNGPQPEGAGHIVELPVPDKPGFTQAYVTDGKGGHTPFLGADGKPVMGRRTAMTNAEREAEQQQADEAKQADQQKADSMNPPGALGQLWNSLTGNPAKNAPQADAGPPAPSAPGGGQHGKVVRTGMKNGQRVAQYEDGTIAPL